MILIKCSCRYGSKDASGMRDSVAVIGPMLVLVAAAALCSSCRAALLADARASQLKKYTVQ